MTAALQLQVGQEITIEAPLSANEVAAGLKPQQLRFIGTDSWGSGDNFISFMSTKARVFNVSEFKSDVVRLRHSSELCAQQSSNCSVLITLQNSEPVDYDSTALTNSSYAGTVECVIGTVSSEVLFCPGGGNITVPCNGTWAGVVDLRCPTSHAEAVCNRLSGIYVADSPCVVLSYLPYQTTCSCPLNSGTNSRRILSAANATTADVEFVAMLEYTATEFVSTWRSADSLTVGSVESSWKVLLTTVLAIGVAVVGALAGMKADKVSAKKIESEKNSIVVAAAEVAGKAGALSSNSALKNPKALVEDSLPNVMKDGTPFSERFAQEVKVYHRWLGLVFYYSPYFTRTVRILSLATTVVVMLFANAITYNTAYPDDGSCETYGTEVDCLHDESSFSGEPKCYWSEGSCEFREPSSELIQVVYVATIAALMSTPIAVFADYIIMEYIAADVKTRKSRVSAMPGLKSASNRSDAGIGRRSVRTVSFGFDCEGSQSVGSSSEEQIRVVSTTSSRGRRTMNSWQSSNSLFLESMSNARRESGHKNKEKGSILATSLQTDMSLLVKSLRDYRGMLSEPDRRSFDGTSCCMLILLCDIGF